MIIEQASWFIQPLKGNRSKRLCGLSASLVRGEKIAQFKWSLLGNCDFVIGICPEAAKNEWMTLIEVTMDSEPIIVLVTCGSEEEATNIANILVEEHLAACVNIVSPIRSIYRWEGRTWDEKEWLLVIKTRRQRFSEIEAKVKSLHSYTVPEIISLPITEGSPSYLNWINENTK